MKTIEVTDGEHYTYLGVDDKGKVDRAHGDPKLGEYVGAPVEAVQKFCVEQGWRFRVISQA